MASFEATLVTDTNGSLPDGKLRREARYEAIHHQQNSALYIKQALELITDHVADIAKLKELLKAADSENERLAQRHNEFLDAIDYDEIIPPNAEAAALKVFNTPELLELILLNLGVDDLCRVQGASRTMRDATDASINIRRKIFLQADERAHLQLLPGLHQGSDEALQVDFRHHPAVNGRFDLPKEEVVGSLYAPYPTIGHRRRLMLIVQPPTYDMTVTPNCCLFHSRPKSRDVIKNKKGITVGDLLDVAQKLVEQYENCPDADAFIRDDEGRVIVGAYIRGTILLAQDDPIVD
ncbi:hypothetical protein LTR85_008288 [Meristemomyces frigidus]|nr:hypothetical protein LTR85_008288 [Meristemomyces frigidus]